LHVEKSILHVEMSILRVEMSVLPVEMSILRVEKSIPRVEKSILHVEMSIPHVEMSISHAVLLSSHVIGSVGRGFAINAAWFDRVAGCYLDVGISKGRPTRSLPLPVLTSSIKPNEKGESCCPRLSFCPINFSLSMW